MAYRTDPVATKDLVEAEGDVARHGIVIIRTIETELAPSIMTAARDSLESSGRKLSRLSEEELDDLVQSLRKAAVRSARELTKLYTRVLSKLGSTDPIELEKDLEGVDELFSWSRISKAIEPVNSILTERGFSALELSGPDDVSEIFKLELEEKWRPAFLRFSQAVSLAAQRARAEESEPPREARRPKKTRK
jgi:hypothetical protein